MGNAFRRSKGLGLLLAGALSLAMLPGCGATLYYVDVIAAGSIVNEAEQAGAPEHAAYDYWLAREYLEKAHEEAAEASYEDAIRFAQQARHHAEQARDRTRERRSSPE